MPLFLAIDIGNSSIKYGLHDGHRWVQEGRTEVDSFPTLLAQHGSPSRIRQAGIASVVPALTEPVSKLLRDWLNVEPTLVTATMALPFEMAYRTPETLGADRLAAAAAAWTRFGRDFDRAVVVVDAGTAATTDVVTSGGVYLGGTIAPGPDALRRCLSVWTAQLPAIEWPEIPSAIGKSTGAALEGGVAILFLEGLRGILRQTVIELGEKPVFIATGGWADWIAARLDCIEHVESNLVLDGIRFLTA